MVKIEVPLTSGHSEILVGPGTRHLLGQSLARLVSGAKLAAVITQEAVVGAGWVDDLDLGLPVVRCLVGDGEGAKRLRTVEQVCSQLARAGLTRGDVVVGIGGGIVTDLAGFIAASYHRGVASASVSTSLLGQVDAAIGGKTGVNLDEGKNLVGAFWQPVAVACDTETLSTLPPREWACGRGEVAKYALLLGGAGSDLLDLDLEDQVAACVRYKAAVVAADEREAGQRALLNYGHTLAHALEAEGLSEGGDPDQLRHGEAVAIGLVFAAHLAAALGRISPERVAEHRRIVAGLDLPTGLPDASSAESLLAHMGRDKKAHHDLTFVLDGPRGVEVVPGVAPETVVATLREMGANP